MPGLDQLRFLLQEPDHRPTLLGQLAAATLTEYLCDPPAAPRVHLGLNTLPDPPLPIAAHVPFAIPEDAWQRCGEDLLAFLNAGSTLLSGQQRPRTSEFGPATRTMQRLMRPDSIVLAWKATMIVAADSETSLILVRELMEGNQRDLNHLDPAIVRPGLAGWAVDRAGLAVFAWARADAAGNQVTVGDEVLDPDDEVFRLLAAILAAQSAWTSDTFGS
jgi:hypothetical protein